MRVLQRFALASPCVLGCVFGLSPHAFAQSFDVTVNGASAASAPGTYANANLYQAGCLGDAGSQWYRVTLQWSPVESNPYVFWDTSPTCNTGNETSLPDGGEVFTANGTTGVFPTTSPSNGVVGEGPGTGDVTIDLRQVMGSVQGASGGAYSCAPPSQGSVYICVTQTQTDATGTQELDSWYMPFNWDTRTPSAPDPVTGIVGDSNIEVGWTYGSADLPATSFNVYYRSDPDAGPPDSAGACGGGVPDAGDSASLDAGLDAGLDAEPPPQVDLTGWSGPTSFAAPAAVGQATGQIDGLTNDQCYDFVVQAVLSDGTLGYTSAPFTLAPIKNYDFWRLYQAAGGQDAGGMHCQSAGGAAALWALAVIGLNLLRRRRVGRGS